jgi:fibro-slime domain-containing protein
MAMFSRSTVLFIAICAAVGAGCASVKQQGGSGGSSGTDGGRDRPGPGQVDAIILPDTITMSCGDGKLDPGEACDDGNKMSGDGCSHPLCQKAAGYVCTTPGQLCTFNAVCGDNTVQAGEACDDGNKMNGDGCSGDCKAVDTGFVCRVPGRPCVPLCGNGMVHGTENCDDGNTVAGDGCSPNCLKETGATCPAGGGPCKKAVCGDGMVDEGETCDKGAENGLFLGNAMGCSKTCTKEPACRDGQGKNRACDVTCGDGNKAMTEECDDGNLKAGDGCSPTCTNESGFMCATAPKADTTPCAGSDPMDPAAPKCLTIPVVYRDFKSEKESGGHPDFFYLGAPISPAIAISNAGFMHNGMAASHATASFSKRYCVPNSGGPAKENDSTARCWDIASENLNAQGKPTFRTTRTNGTNCACQFTDWSHDTNGGHVPGYVDATNGPLNGLPYVSGPVGHPIYRGLAPIVKSAESFAQWFTENPMNVRAVGQLELAPLANGQYRFSSLPHPVFEGFFPLDPAGPAPMPDHGYRLNMRTAGPGTITAMPGTNEPFLCNLWPYYYSNAAFGGTPCRGDQYMFPPSVDMVMYPDGMWVTAMQGWRHNFWYTTEARYLFTHTGAFELQFYGDDDLFIYINGILVLDLGGVHQRLPGRVQVGADGTAIIVEGGNVTAAGDILPCPSPDPVTMLVANATCTGGNCDCRNRMVPLNLAMGSTYEIAVFHADRHPTESNFQLTLSGFSTNRTECQPMCGDGVKSGGEECDEGASNDDTKYGGCTTKCKYGPFCGDAAVEVGPNAMMPVEECDDGSAMNIFVYGQKGQCSPSCKWAHYCGDGVFDPEEQCDLGAGNGDGMGQLCTSMCRVYIP